MFASLAATFAAFFLTIAPTQNLDAVHMAEDRTVMLQDATGFTFCAGFVMASRGTTEYVVSAGHCLEDGLPSKVLFFDGDWGKITAHAGDPFADLSIMEVQSMRAHPAAQLAFHMERGEQLFEIGDPGGNPWTFQLLTDRHGDQLDQYKEAELDFPSVWYGDSGGACWNTKGEVVAVTVALDDQERGLAYAIPASQVWTFIQYENSKD